MYQQKRKHSHLVLLLTSEQLLPSISPINLFASITMTGLPPSPKMLPYPMRVTAIVQNMNEFYQTNDNIVYIEIKCIYIYVFIYIVNDCELKQNIVVSALLCHDLPEQVLNRPWPMYISDPWDFSCPAGETGNNYKENR